MNLINILLTANPVANELITSEVRTIIDTVVYAALILAFVGVIKSLATKDNNATKKAIAWAVAMILFQVLKNLF